MNMITIHKITEVMDLLEGLQAVIFDLDDTLYSEKEYIRSGYHIVARDVLSMIPDAEEKLWQAFTSKKSAFDSVLYDAEVYSEEIKTACLHAYHYQEPDIHLYNGVEEMLKKLRNRRFMLGIITDGRPEGQRAKINALGLEPLVDHIVITDELGGIEYRKPNDRAFILMQEMLDVPFSAMAYVGDNTKKDFIAPEKLGMNSIYFRNADGLFFEGLNERDK